MAPSVRKCGQKAVARVHSIKRKGWVPVCARHAAEFRPMFPPWSEYIKLDSGCEP